MMRVISLGAGVQSSTMALMAAHGEIEEPDFAIFADTGWEPRAVYTWLAQLEKLLSYPTYRVSIGNIKEDLLLITKEGRFVSVPFFTENGGNGRRQCTREYKVTPITKKIREVRQDKEPVELWLGISLDEVIRMKDNRVGWLQNRWPLIEKRMNRHDCIRWLVEHGYPEPTKSSCIGCPYRTNAQWRQLRDEYPEEWQDAVMTDRAIRVKPRFHQRLYMHRARVPLDQVDLSTDEDRGQLMLFNECEGICGV